MKAMDRSLPVLPQAAMPCSTPIAHSALLVICSLPRSMRKPRVNFSSDRANLVDKGYSRMDGIFSKLNMGKTRMLPSPPTVGRLYVASGAVPSVCS